MKNNICIIEPCAGLGNRLLCLYSALYYNNRQGGKVQILWKKEPECNVKFSELFKEIEGLPITETTQMGYRRIGYLIKSIISKIHESILKHRYSFYACKDMQSIYARGGKEQ